MSNTDNIRTLNPVKLEQLKELNRKSLAILSNFLEATNDIVELVRMQNQLLPLLPFPVGIYEEESADPEYMQSA